MRDIDHLMGKAFKDGELKTASNTAVAEEDGSLYMVLHGNRIAARPVGDLNNLTLNLPVRWQTQVTKSRINGIFYRLDFPVELKSIKGIWFFVRNDGQKQPVVNGVNFIHK